ncbi:MAG: 1-acyl-sn-glycerol-3-phosphate acyltransferase [Ruminococcaceae bacterium]|nr:1-acyl-sn-glycerol-3-phosphate acyltransferase [Oscillospiraceae bacterium]
MDVNYKNKKRYNTGKKPIRQPLFIVFLIYILSKIMLIGKKYKLEKINMEGLKPPYILFSNHMYFIDFEIAAMGTFPHRVNNIVSIDGYYRRPWLMELIGAICKRKYVAELNTLRSIKHVLKRGDILCMYPEARYTPIGATSFLPDTLGQMVKMNKVPLVVICHHGNHLHTPFWNFRKARKVPMYATMTQVLTAKQVAEMSVEEINDTIKKALTYDEYKYQKENNIKITEPYRAEGLHKVLYQCPHCMAESKMNSKGTEIFCEECGKRWSLEENGELKALDGETEFAHIPSWFEWERENVRAEIERGEYHFEDEVEVYSLPRCRRFEKLGKGYVTHDPEKGFVLKGHHRGEDYEIHRSPKATNSLHIEYDYCYIKPYDCFDISTENDSFYCYPTKKNVITKLAFAVEELYKINTIKKVKKAGAGPHR